MIKDFEERFAELTPQKLCSLANEMSVDQGASKLKRCIRAIES